MDQLFRAVLCATIERRLQPLRIRMCVVIAVGISLGIG